MEGPNILVYLYNTGKEGGNNSVFADSEIRCYVAFISMQDNKKS